MKSRGGAIRDTVQNKAAVPEYLYGKLIMIIVAATVLRTSVEIIERCNQELFFKISPK